MKTHPILDATLILIALFFSYLLLTIYWEQNTEVDTTPITHHQKTPAELIITLSQNNNFDVATAIRIADCESKLGEYRTNWEGSSARGLFMFIPKTFNAYCEGNIDSDYDQTMCFIKLYPSHPSWWKCK